MMFKLTDIVAEQAVVAPLKGQSRDEVVAELVDALITAGSAPASLRDELIAKVLEREKRGSTGFGKGVAVPHVKHKAVSTMAAAVGLSSRGVDFSSLDRQPVYSIVLLLSPEDNPDAHLRAMEVIFHHLAKDTFRRFLRQAGSPAEVRALFEEADGFHQPS
ncbi:MAG: PTS sugar transporter subunit IIA [Phycisphaerales bacterium]|nr:PTS sugar transporter subunit IIA [Phycisphaerales bacterium]NUQ68067.1 PTS sugar transporter subunit IIA [Phycisphaerales bacterium]